jgi:AraC-like DNA-binding protein
MPTPRWTPEHQAKAEEMRRNKRTIKEIATELGFAPSSVLRHLNPGYAQKELGRSQRWREKYREYQRQKTKEWYWANRERALEKNARFIANNPDYKREWDKANRDHNSERKRKLEKNPNYEREYRKANRERIREYQRQWRLRQKEREATKCDGASQ